MLLFLTDDWIYADDEVDPLFPVIRLVSEHYIGGEDLKQFDWHLQGQPFADVRKQARTVRFKVGTMSHNGSGRGSYSR